MANVDLTKVPAYYHKYIAQVKEEELNEALKKHQSELMEELKKIPAEKWNHRYAEGKWTIKELVQHIIDAERVFCYRALRFARNDDTALPGFDENKFSVFSGAEKRKEKELMEELSTVQLSSAQLFNSFDAVQLERTGTANGNSISVRGIGFIIAGHSIHHKKILLERYL